VAEDVRRGATRSQAHALANDIVKEIRQTPPIFLGKIVFRQQEGAATEICVSDYDGFNPTAVTRDGALVRGRPGFPAAAGFCTPHGKRRHANPQHNLTTGARSVFAGYPGANFSPEISPNGQKVAMILSKSGSPIYTFPTSMAAICAS